MIVQQKNREETAVLRLASLTSCLSLWLVTFPPSSETQGLLAGTMGYFRASDIFGQRLFQELESPWELTLTEPVPEVVEFHPADWPEAEAEEIARLNMGLGTNTLPSIFSAADLSKVYRKFL